MQRTVWTFHRLDLTFVVLGGFLPVCFLDLKGIRGLCSPLPPLSLSSYLSHVSPHFYLPGPSVSLQLSSFLLTKTPPLQPTTYTSFLLPRACVSLDNTVVLPDSVTGPCTLS